MFQNRLPYDVDINVKYYVPFTSPITDAQVRQLSLWKKDFYKTVFVDLRCLHLPPSARLPHWFGGWWQSGRTGGWWLHWVAPHIRHRQLGQPCCQAVWRFGQPWAGGWVDDWALPQWAKINSQNIFLKCIINFSTQILMTRLPKDTKWSWTMKWLVLTMYIGYNIFNRFAMFIICCTFIEPWGVLHWCQWSPDDAEDA